MSYAITYHGRIGIPARTFVWYYPSYIKEPWRVFLTRTAYAWQTLAWGTEKFWNVHTRECADIYVRCSIGDAILEVCLRECIVYL